jgi:predicted RNase H-like HicB family nuclease
MRCAIVIEKASPNYAVYVPGLPGYVATGATIQETETLIREAIAFHWKGFMQITCPSPAQQLSRVCRNFCIRHSSSQ